MLTHYNRAKKTKKPPKWVGEVNELVKVIFGETEASATEEADDSAQQPASVQPTQRIAKKPAASPASVQPTPRHPVMKRKTAKIETPEPQCKRLKTTQSKAASPTTEGFSEDTFVIGEFSVSVPVSSS